MPTIEFLENEAGAAKTVEVAEGGHLVDICDHHVAPVPFSCRSACCATCQIEVVEGAHLLEAPEGDERDLLDVLAGPDNVRLACQAKVRGEPGVIRIKPVGT